MSPESLEWFLLGAVPLYTREELADAASIELPVARRYWRALGFADTDDGQRYYTDADLEALLSIKGLVDDGALDADTAINLTRAFGRTLSRLAEWQVDSVMRQLTTAAPDGHVSAEVGFAVARRLTPELEQLMVYVWRRRVALAVARAIQRESDLPGHHMAVGFADLAGFTRWSRGLEDDALAALVQTFEARCGDVVASLGGRVVKTLGDEVLFVADSEQAGAETALQLVEANAQDDSMPDLRVGVASGAVLTRMGDVFGTTVNLASRLTDLAQAGTVLVDADTAAALAVEPRYSVHALDSRSVRGLGDVEPWLLSRSSRLAGGEAATSSPGQAD